MQKGLVSIITPCYNGEKFVSRFLDSVLDQSYTNIELIVINDGSTDQTEQILKSYEIKFKEKGIKFIHLFQSNGGQSSAINKGLEIFSGEYLTWPDSDDILTPDAIEIKIKYMDEHPDCGILICKTEIVEDVTFKRLGFYQRVIVDSKDNLFLDLITGNNIYYSPGGYMVRSSMFRDAMPNPLIIQCPREIGQNYQLLLPIAYKYPAGYIEDVCYRYIVRAGSHSRTAHSFYKEIEIIGISQKVLRNIIKDIKINDEDIEDINKALMIQKVKNYLRRMLNYHRDDLLVETQQLIKNNDIKDRNIIKDCYLVKYPCLRILNSVYNRILKLLK